MNVNREIAKTILAVFGVKPVVKIILTAMRTITASQQRIIAGINGL